MALMTDVDIKRAIGRDVVIDPFDPDSLTPIGYDFSVGDYVYSLERGLLDANNGAYSIPAKSTVQILTKESLWVSGRLGGTFHSKVSLVSRGMSHISTTLDPGWYGPLLITLRNNTDREIPLRTTDPFVTLLLHAVKSPTKTRHFKPEFRRDILLYQLHKQTEAYVNKVSEVVGNEKALERFQSQVEAANRPMFSKVLASARNRGLRELGFDLLFLLLIASIFFVATLGLYWDAVKPVFQGVAFDTKIVAVQFTAVLALISLAVNVRRR